MNEALGVELTMKSTARSHGPATSRAPTPPGTAGFAAQNKAAIGPRPRPLPGLPRSSGRSVPEDASVRAMRPDQLAEQRAPALTTASGPTRELGPAGACAALFGPTDTHHGRRHSP
ncbi:hypothetical protein ABZ137_02300 [Streptomyces bobili]|uniref:hypothetical protein n=1 Tax=Streptomyces bobili TaxID=67280 RepID=UPI0033BF319B